MERPAVSLNKATKRYSFGVILSRVSGMIRDVVLAYFFGTTAQIATFMIAYRFANLLRRILAETPLSSSFIPSFEALAAKDEKAALLFFRDLLATLAVLVTACIGAAMLCIYPCRFWMSPANQQIAQLTLYMMPSILFLALYGLVAAFLQMQKVFFLSSLAPIAFNGVWIAAACGMGWTGQLSCKLLSVSIVVGFAAQLLFLLPKLAQAIQGRLTRAEFLSPSLFDSSLKPLVKPFFLTAAGVSTTQVNAALDSLFAKAQDPSGPAYLWYAIRIEQVPLALFGIAASTALLPLMTKYLKQNLQDKAQESLQHSLCKVVALLMFSTGGLVCCGVFGLNVLFGRGEFGYSSLYSTYLCLLAYAAGLVFQGLSLVYTSASYALEEFKKPMRISLASIALHLGCNTLFVQGLQLGPISVALSTSIAACFQMFCLAWYVRSCKQIRLCSIPWRRYLMISSMSAAAALCSNYGLVQQIFIQHQLLSFKLALQGCSVGAAVYIGLFFLLEKLLHLQEVRGFFRQRLR